MNESIRLGFRKLPKVLAELYHSNQFLKLSAFASYAICIFLIALLFYQAVQPTEVLTLAPDGSIYQEAPKPNPKLEIERAVREYLKYRYSWTPKTVQQQVEKARNFILPSIKGTFDSSMKDVIRFSTEKNVSQRIYPHDINIDLKKSTVFLVGDRITMIQEMKAAGDLRLELSFESGPRTEENPWGIYISKERE